MSMIIIPLRTLMAEISILFYLALLEPLLEFWGQVEYDTLSRMEEKPEQACKGQSRMVSRRDRGIWRGGLYLLDKGDLGGGMKASLNIQVMIFQVEEELAVGL